MKTMPLQIFLLAEGLRKIGKMLYAMPLVIHLEKESGVFPFGLCW